jgi:hypothetical protein
MGRFEQSQHGGGQADPQEALRRAREAVSRERAAREEKHSAPHDEAQREDEGLVPVEDEPLDRVEDAMREHDARVADDE